MGDTVCTVDVCPPVVLLLVLVGCTAWIRRELTSVTLLEGVVLSVDGVELAAELVVMRLVWSALLVTLVTCVRVVVTDTVVAILEVGDVEASTGLVERVAFSSKNEK